MLIQFYINLLFKLGLNFLVHGSVICYKILGILLKIALSNYSNESLLRAKHFQTLSNLFLAQHHEVNIEHNFTDEETERQRG